MSATDNYVTLRTTNGAVCQRCKKFVPSGPYIHTCIMPMKAYQVSVGGEYCFLIHGETRSKAKYRAYRCDPAGPHNQSEWEMLMFDFKLKRLPLLDNKPITYKNAKVAGFEYESDETDEHGDRIMAPSEEFTSECDCDVCEGEDNSGKY